jgi:hypothetical protein
MIQTNTRRPDRAAGHAPYALIEEILARSEAITWDLARLEWDLLDIFYKRWGACLCRHFPITEHCPSPSIASFTLSPLSQIPPVPRTPVWNTCPGVGVGHRPFTPAVGG